jgi:hypothetical protein
MPYRFTIDVSAALVSIQIEGTGSFEESAAVLRDVAADASHRPEFALLIDAMAYDYAPSLEDARRFRELFRTLKPSFRGPISVAIAPGVRFGSARMVAQLLELLGMEIDIFGDLDSARAWIDARRTPRDPA